MSIEQHQQLLAEIQDPNCAITNLASKTNELTEMCKAGQISKEEYADLIADIQRSATMQTAAVDLQNLEKLNTAINGLITIARLV